MIDKGITYDNIPQLAKPKKGSKRQGFRGPGGYQGSDPGSSSSSSSSSSGGGAPGPGDTGGEGGNSPQDNSTSQFGGGNDRREQYSVTRTQTPIKEEVKVAPISEPERDTGLERQRLKNIALVENLKNTTYEDLNRKLLPPTNPFNIGVNILGSFIGKPGFEKNRDFFVENVAGKYGYGYGLEDYEQYMEDRMSGKVGPYGNENMGQNALRQPDDDRQDTSGILEALLLPELNPTIGPVPNVGFNYIKPYSNQVVVAPGSQGLASLTGGQGFLSSIT